MSPQLIKRGTNIYKRKCTISCLTCKLANWNLNSAPHCRLPSWTEGPQFAVKQMKREERQSAAASRGWKGHASRQNVERQTCERGCSNALARDQQIRGSTTATACDNALHLTAQQR